MFWFFFLWNIHMEIPVYNRRKKWSKLEHVKKYVESRAYISSSYSVHLPLTFPFKPPNTISSFFATPPLSKWKEWWKHCGIMLWVDKFLFSVTNALFTFWISPGTSLSSRSQFLKLRMTKCYWKVNICAFYFEKTVLTGNSQSVYAVCGWAGNIEQDRLCLNVPTSQGCAVQMITFTP